MAILRRAFVAASIGWAALLPLAPFAASQSAPAGGGWYALAFVAFGIGSLVCHQLPERSFHLWSAQMPVCARCTGIYVGAALAAMAYVASGFRLRVKLRRTAVASAKAVSRTVGSAYRMRALLAAAVVPTALTLVYEWTTGDTPSNAIRALAGAPLGGAIAFIVAGALSGQRASGPHQVRPKVN